MAKDEKESEVDIRTKEREDYLRKLRERAQQREITREKARMATEIRAEHAAIASQGYLKHLQARHQFKANIRAKVLEDYTNNAEMMRKVGQIYRRQLKWYVGRDLMGSDQSDA